MQRVRGLCQSVSSIQLLQKKSRNISYRLRELASQQAAERNVVMRNRLLLDLFPSSRRKPILADDLQRGKTENPE